MSNTMKTYAQIQQPTPNLPIPPSVSILDGAVFLGIAGMVGAALRQLWDYYQKKDSSGDTLTKLLIDDLRSNNNQLTEANKQAVKELTAAIQELKDTFKDTGKTIESKVQDSLVSQTNIYTSNNSILNKILLNVEALHKRLDKKEQEESDSKN